MQGKTVINALDETISALRKYESKPKKERKEYPHFNAIYAKTVDLAKRIEIHTEIDKRPDDMIRRRGPYEDSRQYDYREKNWNNITMPYFMKALSKLNRIMNPSNYSINWKPEQEAQQKYFNEGIPEFKSLINFFEQLVITQKIVDPNTLLCVKPKSIPVREDIVDGQIVYVVDDTKEIVCAPYLFDSDDVLQFSEGEYAIVELEEKSWVAYGNGKVKDGIMLEIYTTDAIFRVEQIGKKTDYQFSDPYLYYQHNLGFLPCQKLKGIPKEDDGEIYYQSYFIYAIPHLDVALYNYSNLDMSIITQLFPQRVEYVEKCPEMGCNNGFITEFDGEAELKRTCSRCNGTGTISRVGPMMVKQHLAPDPLNPNPADIPFPGVEYIAPPSEPLEFVYNKFQQDVADAFSFIGFDVSNTKVKGSETALGKQIDREELFAFLMRISNEVFSLLSFTYDAIGKMRYMDSWEMPVISAPTSFAIRSEYDLTQELVEGKKAGLPDVAIRQMIRDFIAKRFSNQKNIEPIINLVFATDRLVTSNTIDITARLANGTCMKWEAVLHDSIYTFIDNALVEDPNFFEKSLADQKKYLIEEAKRIEAEIKTSATTVLKVEDIARQTE